MGNVEEKPLKVMSVDELWAHVFKRFVLWLVKARRINRADAEEIVQEAIGQFVKCGGIADPADPISLFWGVRSRVNGVLVNWYRNKSRKAVTLTPGDEIVDVPDPTNLDKRIDARRAIGTLLDRVANDPLVADVVMCKADGIEDAADIAQELGKEVRDVYNANRRLKVHVENIKKDTEVF